ncbi:serine protease 53-like [Bombina bombina]|uniref:serine protease 53-like n=1 Tax=Bombina bombina TaxID=8345 RepID=UPI00235ABF8B|nr:serine protease 53-like [Bombina bombina]
MAQVLQLSGAATVCGIQGLKTRIYGGSRAVPGEWPWHVALNFLGTPNCGGSLISDRWILTAAHCFEGNLTISDPKSWTAHLGFTRLGGAQESSAVSMVLSKIVIHDSYTDAISGHDLALVELASPVTFTNFISPICLPEDTHRFQLRKTCWTTGLEDVPDGVPLDSKRSLEKVSQTLIGWRTCNCVYNSHNRPELENPTKPGMLCIAANDGDKGPCLGDSGGPVVCNEEGVWFIAGVISFSQGCHLRNSPTVITAVSFYEEWIRKTVGPTAAFNSQSIKVTDDIDTNDCSDILSNRNSGCGIPEIKDVDPDTPGAWPWLVNLIKDGTRVCSGALISVNWVITAAHCFISTTSSDSPFDWSVVVAPGTPAMTQYPVQRINLHGAYVLPEDGADVALVRLLRPAPLGPYTKPACLPLASHRLPYGSTCWHTGWDGPQPDKEVRLPQAVEMKLIGPNKCNCIYSHPGRYNHTVSIMPGMICASHQENEQRKCQSDSGGPLVCKENTTWFLVGVQSFGGECKDRKDGISNPGVYTGLDAYVDWISRVTQDASFSLQILIPPTDLDSMKCSQNSSGCGLSVTSPGSDPVGAAVVAAWPWLVSVHQFEFHDCSGVLIAETWFLTAAHCVSSSVYNSDSFVILGRHSQDGENPHEVRRRIKRIITHPGYNRVLGHNDLALVEVYYGVTFSNYILPICLPLPDVSIPHNSKCWVIGWGNLLPSGVRDPFPPLMELSVHLLQGDKCGAHMESNQSKETQLCAAVEIDGSYICLEDHGAPLVCHQQPKGQWFLLGIKSYGPETKDLVCPGNYTPVSSQLSWIREVISDKNILMLEVPNPTEVGHGETVTSQKPTIKWHSTSESLQSMNTAITHESNTRFTSHNVSSGKEGTNTGYKYTTALENLTARTTHNLYSTHPTSDMGLRQSSSPPGRTFTSKRPTVTSAGHYLGCSWLRIIIFTCTCLFVALALPETGHLCCNTRTIAYPAVQ